MPTDLTISPQRPIHVKDRALPVAALCYLMATRFAASLTMASGTIFPS